MGSGNKCYKCYNYYYSSSDTDNCKNNFLLLGEDAIDGINGSFNSPYKKFSFTFSKPKTNFWWGLHNNHDNSNFFIN